MKSNAIVLLRMTHVKNVQKDAQLGVFDAF
jgi:hypothetical protein